MRYTLQYISLNKIKPESTTTKTSQRKKEFKKVAQDLMHVLIVQKSKKDKGYVIIDGHQHLNFLKKHTHKQSAVCLVDESKLSVSVGKFVDRFRKQSLPIDIPAIKSDRVTVSSWSIIRTFLKREPRFRKLTRRQQLKVLRLGMQYKKTTVRSMQDKVDELCKKMVTH